MFRSAWIFAAMLIGIIALRTGAQVFYEPVQTQYQYNGQAFYYAGHDVQMFDHIHRDIDRTNYTSAVTQIPVVHRQRIFSDSIPFEDLADNHLTSYRTVTTADVQNEANAAVPRYFRKKDLLAVAERDADGTWIVPADAQPRASVKIALPAAPTTQKGTILIIPKTLLNPQKQNGFAVVTNR